MMSGQQPMARGGHSSKAELYYCYSAKWSSCLNCFLHIYIYKLRPELLSALAVQLLFSVDSIVNGEM